MTQSRETDEAYIRRIVVDEITKHLKPMHDWMLGFWSNGSGRPPGFFQMRVKQDDERYERLASETADQSKVLSKVDAYVTEEMTLRKHRAERWKFWWPKIQWLLGGVGIVLLAIVGWVGPHAVKVVDILWQDYLRYHPGLSTDLKKAASSNQQPVSERTPQDAATPAPGTPIQ